MSITSISSSNYTLDQVYNNNRTGSTSTGSVQNGQQKPEPPSVEDIVSMLTSKLGLNDNQMIELKKIIQDSMSSIDEEASSADSASTTEADRKTAMNKMKSKMDEMDNKIKTILTDDQLSIFESMISQRNSGAM